MLHATRASLVALVLLLILPALEGCSAARSNGALNTGTRLTEEPDSSGLEFGAVLPPPSELLPSLGSEKRASYSETDYIKHGREYYTSAPNQNVTILSDSALFDTNWSAATSYATEELGICFYVFENLGGYTREPELRYGWEDPPDDIGTAWLGLSNWDNDTWDWQRCSASGIWALPSFDSYTSPIGEMVAVMVLANAETSSLRWIRLGPPLLTADLQLIPATGLTSLNVTLDASASTTDVGSIALYEWDTDESGTFAVDTGPTPTFNVITGIVGPRQYAVRVTSEYGTQDTATADYYGYAPWAHSIGGSSGEKISCVATDDAGFIYAAGATPDFGAGMTNGLLLKYDLVGNLLWAKAWSYEKTDNFYDVQVDGNGDLIVVGETYSTGPGGNDALIQKWDSDGNVIWSYNWGDSAIDHALAVSLYQDAIYVTGNTESYGAGGKDVMLLKLNSDGSLAWQRVWGGADYEYARDVSAWKYLFGLVSVYISGATGSFGAGDNDVLYLRFTEEGDLATQRCWGNADYQIGNSISVSGYMTPSIFIGGTTGGSTDRDFLLLEVGSTLANTWGGASLDDGYGIQRVDDSLILSGETKSFSAHNDGLLVSFTTDGIFDYAALFGTADEDETFLGMSWFPGKGLVLGGSAATVEGCSWSEPSGTATGALGTWVDLAETAITPAGALTARSGTVTDITTATIDTGGGSSDALVVAKEIKFL